LLQTSKSVFWARFFDLTVDLREATQTASDPLQQVSITSLRVYPCWAPSSCSFGQVTAVAPPRRLQLGMRF